MLYICVCSRSYEPSTNNNINHLVMAQTQFIDYIKIFFQSGNGGRGSVHFRREKFVPNGGPDGGDGGRGGDIILEGDRQLSTLLHLKYRKYIRAPHGQPGKAQNAKGKDGKDIILKVPLGTLLKDEETGELKGEITSYNQRLCVCKGGQGGQGNNHFKTAARQAPRYAQGGESGQKKWMVLELRLLADVGLIGHPNAGKSTLLSLLSAAKPRIAPYAFTTLTPQLGVVSYGKESFVLSDIPGLIAGASQGKGLGIRFLRHIQRNKVLLFVISAEEPDILQTYHLLCQELAQYDPELLQKKRMLVVTKQDLINSEEEKRISKELSQGINYCLVTAMQEKGLQLLKQKILVLLQSA